MENCRIIELTADTSWDLSEVTSACVNTSTYETLDEMAHRTIRARGNSPQPNDNFCCSSNLSVNEPTSMIRCMLSSVHGAIAHCDDVLIAYIGAKDRHSCVTLETDAKKFRCGLEIAQRALETATQRGVALSLHSPFASQIPC
jgi:hypothetical protein